MRRSLHYFFTFLLLLIGFAASAQEPTNHATGFSVTGVSSTAIDIDWTDATGATDPEFYLIVGRELPGGTFAPVADGPEVATDNDWSDGNFAAIVAHGGGSSLSVTGLDPGIEYEFAIYSYTENAGNGNYKIGGQPTDDDFTFSDEPGGHSSTFTATLNGDVDIDLVFDAANTLTNADGYLIYRRTGSAASLAGLNDGAAPPASLGGTTTLINTTNNSATSYTDPGLQGGVTYHYVLVPFNYNGANNGTYNYLTDGSEPRANATTNLIISMAELTGGVSASPLNTGSSNVAILGFSITTNGPTTFNSLNVAVSSTPVGKFTNPRIFKSANNSFGGDASINSGSLTATHLVFSSVGDVLTAGTSNYFIVINVSASASGSIEPSLTQANITFTSPSGTPQNVTITGDTYTFVDASPPTISSSIPADGATGVSVLLNTFTITFDESVAFVGDNTDDANRIRIWDDDANAFVETIEVADVSVVGSGVTFTTDYAFVPDTDYDIIIGNSVFEDITGNDFPGIAEDIWEFQIEAIPNITSFSNSGTRCIGDVLTINGGGFTGTGGLGNTKPVVTMEGVTVPPVNITAFTNASITLTIPTGVPTGAGVTVIVVNQDNMLSSDGSDDLTNVFDQINTGLIVIPETSTPAQNTNVDIEVQTTQDNNYNYAMILTAAPGSFSSTPPKTVHTLSGNNGTITLNTAEGADPDFNVIGDYTFRIDVSRTGCTTKTLTNTPFTLTVASLTVSASATSTTVCSGNSTILIGSANGGTGFYQFRWSSDPAGYASTASSPTVSPTANIRYILEVEDNAGNIVSDFVDIVVNPGTTASFAPAPGETSVRTNYTIENNDFRLYGNPEVLPGDPDEEGVFTGPGVTLKNDGYYYFNPSSAGVGTKVLSYTYTNPNGCQAVDQITLTVSNFSINNLKQVYCKAENLQSNLNLNLPNSGVTLNGSNGWQFSRLVFYNGACYNGDLTTSTCGYSSPLTLTSTQNVTPLPGFLSTIPSTYSLDLNFIRTTYGYSYVESLVAPGKFNYFYVLVYGRNALGIEQLRSSQFFRVVDNGPAPFIVGINEKENICSDATPITLSSSIAGYAVNQFSITPSYAAGSLTGTVGETFNPGHTSLTGNGKAEEPLSIKLDYKDNNNCPASVTTNFNWVSKPIGPIATVEPFCQVVDGKPKTYTIKGAPNPADLKSTPIWYDAAAPATVLDQINWEFTAPGVTGLIPLVKTYLVQQEYKGCKGSTTSVDLEIKPAPGAAFTPPAICQGKDFDLVGPIDTGLGQPYKTYEWNFGDLSLSQVVSGDENITYNYQNDGNYNIKLTVTNDQDCENTETRSITVGLNPKPNFTFKQVCEGDLTEFSGSADIGVEKYEWDFGDGVTIPAGNSTDAVLPPNTGTYINPRHTFSVGSPNASGDYTVTVTSYTNIGCSSSFSKVVTILDTLVRTTLNPYNMSADLDGDNNPDDSGKGYWRLEDVNGNSTWEFAQPTTPLMKEFTSPAWVTNADGFYSKNEKSYLNSPCLNIANIERPILSMDLVIDTDKNIEGAVLEYSKDNGVNWLPVGLENSGLNWFNTTGFRIGNIGNSPVGWSGLSSKDLNDNPGNKILVQARRALDNLPNLSKPDRAKVRFRIAFASTTDVTKEFEGIGFNNLSISTRDRISLLEMFTNVNADNYTPNNNVFKAIAIDEIAKIQYHVTYSGSEDENEIDPNSIVNKADPAARAAYYGIPMSDQYIPRSYVDGHSEGSLIDGNWAITEFNKQSLQNSQYNIKIDSMKADDNSYLKMKVTVEAKVDVPATRNHILHIAVVEKVVGANEFVLRKLVPDANGHALPVMNQADTEIVIDSVQLDKSFVNVNNLAIVAFVQDQDIKSREVFQAAIELKPGYLPELITGVESLGAEQISVYPNPASKQFRVELPAIVTNDVNVQLIDQVGRKHDGGFIRAGSNAASINVEHLSEGIYILEIGSSESIIRKKVMVVMKN